MRKNKIKLKIRKSKKAFLFTLGLVFVCLAILSFAKFVFDESEDEKILFQTAAIINRLDDIDSSLQKSTGDTFEVYSNIKAYFENSTLVFEEPLPNSIAGLESGLNRLKNMAEANDTSIYLEVNETLSNLPIFVLPQNLSYRHNFSTREIIINMQQINSTMLKYKTTVTIEENVSCSWSFTPGNFNYELKVISPKDSGCDRDRLVELSKNVTITITSQSEADNKITINLDAGSFKISMDTSSTFSAGVKSEIYFNDFPKEAWLGNDLIQISYDNFKLKREGGARII